MNTDNHKSDQQRATTDRCWWFDIMVTMATNKVQGETIEQNRK